MCECGWWHVLWCTHPVADFVTIDNIHVLPLAIYWCKHTIGHDDWKKKKTFNILSLQITSPNFRKSSWMSTKFICNFYWWLRHCIPKSAGKWNKEKLCKRNLHALNECSGPFLDSSIIFANPFNFNFFLRSLLLSSLAMWLYLTPMRSTNG